MKTTKLINAIEKHYQRLKDDVKKSIERLNRNKPYKTYNL